MHNAAGSKARGTNAVLTIAIPAVLILTVGAIATAEALRAGGLQEAAPIVVPVSHAQVEARDQYIVERVFTGRVEAARQSALGFELDGLLAEVLVEEGDAVVVGQPLARLDTARLGAQREELEAALAQAEADRALAQITVDRLAGVVESGGVSRQGLDEARERLRAAEAAVRLGHARLDSVGVELDKAVLKAPFDGVISRRAADEGRVLNAGSPVLELLESTLPEARLGVAGPLVDRLRGGQSHEVEIRGLTLPATVKAVSPARAAGARTVDIVLQLDRADAFVRPGDLVTLALQETVLERGFWVPLNALAEGSRGLWTVYTLAPAEGSGDASHAIEARVVEVIHQQAGHVYVGGGGLEDGTLIIAEGLHRVVPGQLVRLSQDSRIQIAKEAERHVVN